MEAYPSHAHLGSATCITSRCMGINLGVRVRSCGQLSLVATYAQAKDVDSHGAPVEHPKVQRYPRSGELDSHLARQARRQPLAGFAC
jgi:hypothetical protein